MRKHHYFFSFLQEIRIRTQIIHVHVGLKSNSKEEGHGRVRLREVWLWVDRTTRSLTLQWAGQRGVYCTLGGHWASHCGWTVKPFYVVFFVRIFCLLQFLVHLMSKHPLTKMTKNTLTYSPWNETPLVPGHLEWTNKVKENFWTELGHVKLCFRVKQNVKACS